ncbi:response regulator [Paractinoplanes hotanensis]|uniref:Response regulator n=1 Tax=Paractinoplanes hotanensis TaxID=2906497 RepID=A0ABT0YB24_9ACTN|nr:response regulator [Actinoplanes hotanensis]MCM4082504.1 response regulator [Actinoplanes hotanensis]
MVRVLLVEDDESIAEPLADGLSRYGITTDRVGTGAAALSAPLRNFVLLDLGLPDIDGIDVCRRLRQVSDVPIIMLTARGDETDRRGSAARLNGARRRPAGHHPLAHHDLLDPAFTGYEKPVAARPQPLRQFALFHLPQRLARGGGDEQVTAVPGDGPVAVGQERRRPGGPAEQAEERAGTGIEFHNAGIGGHQCPHRGDVSGDAVRTAGQPRLPHQASRHVHPEHPAVRGAGENPARHRRRPPGGGETRRVMVLDGHRPVDVAAQPNHGNPRVGRHVSRGRVLHGRLHIPHSVNCQLRRRRGCHLARDVRLRDGQTLVRDRDDLAGDRVDVRGAQPGATDELHHENVAAELVRDPHAGHPVATGLPQDRVHRPGDVRRRPRFLRCCLCHVNLHRISRTQR